MSEVFGRKGPGTLKSGLIADDITSLIVPALEILVTRIICCYQSGENDEIESAEAQEISPSRHDNSVVDRRLDPTISVCSISGTGN